ncbi:transposase [Blastococcus sp. TML/M2B]|uniref:Mu transposase C-terminal domain-containing protein n=1 Tax=unclassified Blastococcus TaxID=2619396 RepID=UPI00190922E0|nr:MULTISPECIES: Mu transposase C-terminal domain-containing protein [unclassified Blastococcus]MBN1093444.1 transposase [Blastococcus sp. TML/M2B]MBN1096439.1 transposase [Blastococcus sp. TML/C7B]
MNTREPKKNTNKPKYMRTARDRAVDALMELAKTRPVTPDDVRREAAKVGYSARQVQRALDAKTQGRSLPGAARFAVTEAVITAVFLCCGGLAQAYQLLAGSMSLPSESTFRRCVRAAMGSQIEYARGGSAGYRDHQLYLRNDYPHRMHSVLLDHTELPIFVVPRGYKTAVKPWITAVMDGSTRYVLSWVVTFGRPTAEEVRASLVQAMTLRVAGDGETIVGGRPMKAVWDRGLEFLATLITESCLRLQVMPIALAAYSPHLKGRLERFWLTLKRSLLPPLPGYSEGPHDLRGQHAIADNALGEDEFLVLLDEWITDYNTNHVVSTMKMTPLQAWKADGTPLEEIAPEQLWHDFLTSKDRCKVSKNGIRWDTIDWVAPELVDVIGRHVEIRHLPHDRSFIEVFLNGEHLCTAIPVQELSDEERQATIERRQAARAQAQKRFTTANRMRVKNHPGTSKIRKDKDGKRQVIGTSDDLLSGGDDALKQLLGQLDADGADGLGGVHAQLRII